MSTTLKERVVGGIVLFAAITAIAALGYAVGKDTNDSLLSYLREKNQEAEKTETRLRAEISSLKLELKSTMGSVVPELAVVGSAEGGVSAPAPASPKEPAAVDIERIVLNTQSTASLFDGKVFVSLVGISFEGSPLRHKVMAALGSPGKQNMILDKVDVGYVATFEGYEVRVTASDTFTASFTITRLDAKN